MNIAEKLKTARGALSQRAASELCNVKQQAWCGYEKGTSAPGAEAIRNIWIGLAVSADWLLDLPEHGQAHTVVANGNGAVAAGHDAVVGGDCSKCLLMQEHIRQITGRS